MAEVRAIHESGFERQEGDFYPTPAWVTECLLSSVTLRGPIWEPCCGDGALAKVLSATGESLDEFVALVSSVPNVRARMVPLIGLAQAGSRGYFDDAGFPAGSGWENIAFPEIADAHCYALEITGESMLPVYRDGDRILVSPSGSLRRGDRVVVKTHAGEVMAKQLGRMTAQRIELKSFNPVFEDRGFALSEVAFVHRIIWASQ